MPFEMKLVSLAKEGNSEVHTIRGWALRHNVSFIELAFQAYQIYSSERSAQEVRRLKRQRLVLSQETETKDRKAGPYSFINLMSFVNKRYELLVYLYLAIEKMEAK